MKNTISFKDVVKQLEEKSQEIASHMAREWIYFLKKKIYLALTPSGYLEGSGDVMPRKKFYRVGKKYAAWRTAPGLSFDYRGKVVCIKSGWRAQHKYEGDAGPIIGYCPWGIFKDEDGAELNQFDNFITTIEIKEAIEQGIDDYRCGVRGVE